MQTGYWKTSPSSIWGGVPREVIQRLESLETSRASADNWGLARICGQTDVTEENGMVLGTREKNPAIEGSLGSKIEKIRDMFNKTVLILQGSFGSYAGNEETAPKGIYTTGNAAYGFEIPAYSYLFKMSDDTLHGSFAVCYHTQDVRGLYVYYTPSKSFVKA